MEDAANVLWLPAALECNYYSPVYEVMSFCGISRGWDWGKDLKLAFPEGWQAGKLFEELSGSPCAGEGYTMTELGDGEA